jgi:hypothetical protein
MRAAVIVNPAATDVGPPGAGGQDTDRRRLVNDLGAGNHANERSLDARIEPGALAVRAPQSLATGA